MPTGSDLLVGNGILTSLSPEVQVAPGGAMLLRGGMIAATGDTAALRFAYPGAEFIDAGGQYIMPGMICAHTHTYGAFARGMALKDPPPQDFVQILERLWWRLDRTLTPDDVYYSAMVCLVDAVRHGTTTLVDHHASPNACTGSLDAIARAFTETGLRGALCYEVSDREGKAKAQEGLRENERFIKTVQSRRPGIIPGAAVSSQLGPHPDPLPILGEGEEPSSPRPSPVAGKGREQLSSQPSTDTGMGGRQPMLAGMMGLHAAFTLSDETITQAVGTAYDLGVGCHIHVAEGTSDADDSLRSHGMRTVERLQRLGVLGPQSIAAHCIHIDERELSILAETGTMVVHNPRSNMNNAVGTARVEEMLRNGIGVGLGNDGFSNDMFVEMKAAYLAHKARQGNPQAMPAGDVLHMAATNNGHIADVTFGGLASRPAFGRLEAGAPADIILVDYQAPTPLAAGNLPWHAIFGIDGSMVTTTIVAGRVLMRDRSLVDLDEAAIYARARQQAAALWQRF